MEDKEKSIMDRKFRNPHLSREELELSEIVNSKRITVLEFSCLSKEKEVKAKGIKGFFGFKTTLQEEMPLVICDAEGISLDIHEETGTVRARFSSKKEFEKINSFNFDTATLRTSYVMNSKNNPYLVMFHIENLQQIFWQDY